ncbi:DIP1984 family protein [Agrococcus sp. ARC_14]|uniref:DIP1984 family protein n=1 Tax=Agrococcus sp. ARC_14 TaxID=2919927 RepID=UPI001F062FC6|nr:DIP1984 family protein [Agrococcus sp. ARC_14]MCH1882026.1 DIP1984 family protein [Agrococcus sp. ARC_14]
MQLAAALAHRADLTTRRDVLLERATRSALVQEGSTPTDDVAALLEEHARVGAQLEELVVRINLTNTATRVGERSMTAALARRETLRATHRALRQVANAATPAGDRMRAQELRLLPAIEPRDLHEQAEAVAKELRELDLAIQEVNWTTQLNES